MANENYIERLKQVIFHLHKCDTRHVETVPVTEVFEGRTIWEGDVEVFETVKHPKATHCYAWSHIEGQDEQGERFVTVLGLPPVNSPETAVKVAIASEVRSKSTRQKRKDVR